jgi:rhodanese-related sulfurtransferase
VVAGLFLAVGAGAGCVEWLTGSSAVQDVTPEEAHALIDAHAGDSNFVILDVRNPDEFATYHIANAVNVCYLCDDFSTSIAALDKSKTYLVYCGTNHRSPLATAAMIDAGFTSVYNMTGGLAEWEYAVVQ